MWILSFSSFPFPILLLVSISSPLHPPLLPPPLLLPYPFPLSPSLPFLVLFLYPHTLIYLVVSVLNIQAHYTSVDIWYRERKTNSHMCGPCIWGHIKWTVATPLWDWQTLNPWPWFGAFCTVPSAFSKRERKMWQEPVPVTWSMIRPPSAVGLTVADLELGGGTLFQNLTEFGKHHFPRELSSLAVDQVVFAAILHPACNGVNSQASSLCNKASPAPPKFLRIFFRADFLLHRWCYRDRMCSESHYSPWQRVTDD